METEENFSTDIDDNNIIFRFTNLLIKITHDQTIIEIDPNYDWGNTPCYSLSNDEILKAIKNIRDVKKLHQILKKISVK